MEKLWSDKNRPTWATFQCPLFHDAPADVYHYHPNQIVCFDSEWGCPLENRTICHRENKKLRLEQSADGYINWDTNFPFELNIYGKFDCERFNKENEELFTPTGRIKKEELPPLHQIKPPGTQPLIVEGNAKNGTSLRLNRD